MASSLPGSSQAPAQVNEQKDKKEADIVTAVTTVQEKVRPFNGWTKELEELFAEWADKASCYRWMHEKTARVYHTRDQGFMFPIIIMSTLGGAANFAMNSISQDATIQKYVQLGLGGLSIATGILTTIANRLGYASSAEGHRGESISWGKFNRLIIIELSLHPDERMEAFAFLKMFRIELDRLIEQSPTIPELIINKFIYEFKEVIDLKKPDITGDLEHTRVFSDKNTRLKQIAQDVAMTLNLKKGVLKQLVLDDLETKIRRVIADYNKGSPTTSPKPLVFPPTPINTVNTNSKAPLNTLVLPIVVKTVKRSSPNDDNLSNMV
jgi:hypothetical protein